MASGADVLAEGLARWGASHLFGMPGSHSTTIYDAIVRQGSISTILIRNEQAAAFAADGYARVSGRPGIVCTTAGPGATNALSGVAECWADSVPILLLVGPGQLRHPRSGVRQLPRDRTGADLQASDEVVRNRAASRSDPCAARLCI